MEKQIRSLKNQILDTMPDNLSTMEQVRYLYIELGKIACFDERYWKGNSKTRQRIYKGSFRKKLEDLKKDRRVICTSLSVMLQELLKEIGIKAELHKPIEEDPHTNLNARINGIRYIFDLQRDLEYIVTNRKTKFFGKWENEIDFMIYGQMTDDEIEAIDRKLGYLQEGINYTDVYIELLKKSVENKGIPLEEKVAFILEHANDYKDLSSVGIVEKSKFYNWCLNNCLNFDERKRVTETFLEVRREEKKEERKKEVEDKQFVSCISVRGSENRYVRFLFSDVGNRYLQTDETEFERLLETRLKQIPQENIPGIKMKNKKYFKKETSACIINFPKEEGIEK